MINIRTQHALGNRGITAVIVGYVGQRYKPACCVDIGVAATDNPCRHIGSTTDSARGLCQGQCFLLLHVQLHQAIVYVQTVFSRTVMGCSGQTEIVGAFRHRRAALSDVELSNCRAAVMAFPS